MERITANHLIEGQLWYNTSSGKLKGYTKFGGVPSATWASGGSMNTARFKFGLVGTQTATMAVSGEAPGPAKTVNVETYDGTSWTEGPNVVVAKNMQAAFGTTTSAIMGPGNTASESYDDTVETWNGSAWTETGDVNDGRNEYSCAGASNTSGLVIGGNTPGVTANVENWNGA